MIVLVCGGRNFGKVPLMFTKMDEELAAEQRLKPVAVLDRLKDSLPVTRIVQGGATGADTLAAEWARRNKISVRTYVADWDVWGKAAGFKRNERMLEEGKPDLVVAFKGGKGTKHMVELAKRAGVRVLEEV